MLRLEKCAWDGDGKEGIQHMHMNLGLQPTAPSSFYARNREYCYTSTRNGCLCY